MNSVEQHSPRHSTSFSAQTSISEEQQKDIAWQIEGDAWEKTFDAMQDVVTILSPDYRIIRANKATYSTFKLNSAKIAGKFCYEIFHGKSSPCSNCPIRHSSPATMTTKAKVYNSMVDKTFEVSSSTILNDDGSVRALVHTARDITQQLKDEAQMAVLSAAMEQTTEAVVITDLHGSIEYCNPSFTRTTGYSAHEVRGNNIRSPQFYDHAPCFIEETWKTLHDGEVLKGRIVTRKKDGSTFEENVKISPIFDTLGRITNFIAVKTDVTKEELLEKQLQQAIKMEAIGTLAGGIAHDFNNILSAMIGYAQITKSRMGNDNPLIDDIDQILIAGDRAVALVKQILTFSRKDNEHNFQIIRAQPIVKEALKLLRSSLPSTIQLVQHIDSTCGSILADPSQIHQVLMNLCTNAMQAINNQYGTLRVDLRQIEVSGKKESLLTEGSYLELVVKDSGSGMNRYIQKRMFDPFYSTKLKNQGTGLGLSVVHGIVKKHGGEISVESRVGKGTSIHIFFPVVSEKPIEATNTVETDPGGKEHIMVVDDEPTLARLMQRMLVKLGYKVSTYTDSLQAVREYRDNPYQCDAVVTDMTMPRMTGAELARELLSIRPELPIVMTTGFNESINEKKAAFIGIKELLHKPVRRSQLSQIVRKVLDDG